MFFENQYFSIIVILVMTVISARLVKFFLNKHIEFSTFQIKTTHDKQLSFVRDFIVGVVYFIGVGIAIYSLPQFKNLSVSLFASSGIIAITVGFASQHALSNIVSGVFIAIFKPFGVNDRIRIPGKEVFGTVEDITLRHTIIRTFQNKRIVIPNSIISTEMIENFNLTDQKICEFIEMGISYDSDIDRAIEIMRNIIERHPAIIDAREEEEIEKNEPIVAVRVISFGDSSVNLRAWAWFKDPSKAFVSACDIRREIKLTFDREGIEIPFPHRTIVYKEKKQVKENY